MVNRILSQGKKLLSSQQNSILSAASVVATMIVLAQFFGLVRQWTILRFLGKDTFSLFMAAFRLPDLVFEVFAFGAFSSAFIPVFAKYLRKDERMAWDTASRVINIGLIIFFLFALLFGIFSFQFYSIVAFGFNESQTRLVSEVSRVIFFAQGFFVISYVITGVLESSKRFLIPALAPVFYNIGIILGTIIFWKSLGIYAPAAGVVVGALIHLLIQLPVAYKLGFRFTTHLVPNEGVKEVGALAGPRFIDLGALQIQKSAELFFASLLSVASYAYLNLANSLQAVPTMLFGVSLAKAALVSLSHLEDVNEFKRIFMSTLNQMMFVIIPISAFLFILRIPVVRLTFGTSQSLDWDGTIQVGLVLASFAFGIPLQAAVSLLSRAFYAKHDTKIPVVLSVVDVVLTLILEAYFVLSLHYGVWSIALANTLAALVQTAALYILLAKKIGDGKFLALGSIVRSTINSSLAAGAMYLALKIFDRSAWILRGNIPFERFVIDTRYTLNLIILTFFVGFLGAAVYLGLSWLTKSEELYALVRLVKRGRAALPSARKEVIIPPTTDTNGA